MKIKSKLLRGAQMCQAKNDIRYYLNGIHIKGNYVEATNGHVCVRMTMDKEVETERIVNIHGKVPVRAVSSIFEFGEVEAIVKHYDLLCKLISVQIVDVIEGNYPDVERVMPADKNKLAVDEIGLETSYISLFYDMFKCQAKLEFFGVSSAVRLTPVSKSVNNDYGNPIFVVMPCSLPK